MNSKIPCRCSGCRAISFHDVSNLSKRPLDDVITVEGFDCPHCEMWEPVVFTTTSLLENISRLEKLPVGSRKYRILMAKTIKKANNLKRRLKGEFSHDGESEHNNMATT